MVLLLTINILSQFNKKRLSVENSTYGRTVRLIIFRWFYFKRALTPLWSSSRKLEHVISSKLFGHIELSTWNFPCSEFSPELFVLFRACAWRRRVSPSLSRCPRFYQYYRAVRPTQNPPSRCNFPSPLSPHFPDSRSLCPRKSRKCDRHFRSFKFQAYF